jgi:hypothetical protein
VVQEKLVYEKYELKLDNAKVKSDGGVIEYGANVNLMKK